MKKFEEIKLASELDLKSFEKERLKFRTKEIRRKVIVFSLAGILAIILAFIFLPKNWYYLFLSIFGISLSIWVLLSKKADNYKNYFKTIVLKNFFKQVDNSILYEGLKMMAASNFKKSGFLHGGYTYYYGNDYFYSKIDNISFDFSDIYIKFGTGRYSQVIFDGKFFIIDIKRKIDAEIIILPNVLQKKMGQLGKTMQRNTWNGLDKQTCNNEEFNKEYIIYSNTPEKISETLSPRLQSLMLDLKSKHKHSFYLSFREGLMFLGISNKTNNLKADINKSLLKPDTYKQYYDYFNSNFELIKKIVTVVEQEKVKF